MTAADTLREPQIPLPAPPPTADGKAAPEMRLSAAMGRLLWLTLYVAIMRLFGYRIRRDNTRRPARASLTQAVTQTQQPAAPAAPRRKHRYLDRDMCLHMLGSINTDFAPAPPQPDLQSPAPPAAAPPATAPRSAARAAHPIPSARSSRAQPQAPSIPVRPRVPAPRRQKTPSQTPTSTHAYFVAIS